MLFTPAEFYKRRTPIVLVDIRPLTSYVKGSIPQALSFPLEENVLTENFIAEMQSRFSDQQFVIMDQQGAYPSALVESDHLIFLQGGYDAYVLWQKEIFASSRKLVLLGGKTGTGKTRILNALFAAGEKVIDLEKLAAHKGSVFGNLANQSQPANDFFHDSIFNLLCETNPGKTIWVEEEGPFLGTNSIPSAFYESMLAADMIELVLPFEIRLNNLIREYGASDPASFLKAIALLEKRMGRSENHKAIAFYQKGDLSSCFRLLLQYYDKVYDYRRENYRKGKKEEFDIAELSSNEIVKRLIELTEKKETPE